MTNERNTPVIVLAIIAGVVALAIFTGWFAIVGRCEDRIIATFPSPDGALKLGVFEREFERVRTSARGYGRVCKLQPLDHQAGMALKAMQL